MGVIKQPLAALTGEHNLAPDLVVRRMGFGAMRITGEGIWGYPADRGNALAVLRRALEIGVNLIDTADSYGPGVSEELIAEALYPYPSNLVIATKGGLLRDGPGLWKPDCRPDHLRAACEGSLKRLRLDCIDLYQLHTVDQNVAFEESVGALVELKEQGKIRHIGLSNVSVEQLRQAQAMTDVVSVQNHYNLTDHGSEDVLEACEADGIGFIPWFPLARGSLTEPSSIVDQIAKTSGATPAQIALAWLLNHSPVMLPIPGTASVAHLEENVAAAPLELGEQELASLDQLAA